jgi:hypothetical protein
MYRLSKKGSIDSSKKKNEVKAGIGDGCVATSAASVLYIRKHHQKVYFTYLIERKSNMDCARVLNLNKLSEIRCIRISRCINFGPLSISKAVDALIEIVDPVHELSSKLKLPHLGAVLL